MANVYQNLVFNGLGTLSMTVPEAGQYRVNSQTTLPTLANGGGVSAVVTDIQVNTVSKILGVAGATGAQGVVTCAANDVISVVYSSAATADQPKNVIKSSISISEGF